MEYSKLKEMADLMSVFLLTPMPVYMVEEYLKTGNPVKICERIKQECKEGIDYYPIDIVEKVVSLYE